MSVQSARLAELYLAYLGRPEDAWGAMAYGPTATVFEPPRARAFWESTEYAALQAGADLSGLIDEVYQRLFNRSAEAQGQAYWQAEVSAGRLDRSLLPIGILQGAQNADAIAVANKLAAAGSFFQHLDTAVEKTAYAGAAAAGVARGFLHSVTADSATLDQAVKDVDLTIVQSTAVGQPPGVSFVLSTADDRIDTVTPSPLVNTGFGVSTNSDDSFVANLIAGVPTLGAGDRIDGGAGFDTLLVAVNGDITTAPGQITSVEHVKVTVAGTGSLDLSGVRDLQAVDVAGDASEPGIVTLHGIATADAMSMQLDKGTGVVLDYADASLPDQSLTLDVSHVQGSLAVPGIEHLTLMQSQHTAGTIVAPDAQSLTLISSVDASTVNQLVALRSGTIVIDGGNVDGQFEAGGIVVQGHTVALLRLGPDVRSVTSVSSGGVSVVLDQTAGAGETVAIAAQGTGNLQVIGGGNANIVATGSPNQDNLYGGNAADTFTGGGGDDNFVFQNRDTGAQTASQLIGIIDTITDFSAGDRLWCGSIYAPGSHAGSAPGVAAISSGFATFDAADHTLADKVAAVAAAITPSPSTGADYRAVYAIFADGGDSYVFISDALPGISGFDTLVRLTGVPADPARFHVVQDVIFGA